MTQSETAPSSGPLVAAPGATASMVCGILSIVFVFFPIAGLILGIIAIVLASKAKAHALANPTRYALGGARTAGLVCGIIGTALSAIYGIMLIAGIAWLQTEEGKKTLDELRRLEEERRNR